MGEEVCIHYCWWMMKKKSLKPLLKKLNGRNSASGCRACKQRIKAMDMLEEMQPDVVMTDIRMPYMDGLELCAHIKAKYPATKILLFTGFDDFEYAKEAVHLEIEEYI